MRHQKEYYRGNKSLYYSNIWKDSENTGFTEKTPHLGKVDCLYACPRLLELQKQCGSSKKQFRWVSCRLSFQNITDDKDCLKEDGVPRLFSRWRYLCAVKFHGSPEQDEDQLLFSGLPMIRQNQNNAEQQEVQASRILHACILCPPSTDTGRAWKNSWIEIVCWRGGVQQVAR